MKTAMITNGGGRARNLQKTSDGAVSQANITQEELKRLEESIKNDPTGFFGKNFIVEDYYEKD